MKINLTLFSKIVCLVISTFSIACETTNKLKANPKTSIVSHSGSLKEVMREGNLKSSINLSHLDRKSLFAVGPLNRLSGEVTVVDGECYISKVHEAKIKISKSCDVEAPFLVWSNPHGFEKITKTIKVKDLNELNSKIDGFLLAGGVIEDAVTLKIKGLFKNVRFHILDLSSDFSGMMNHQNHHKIQKGFVLESSKPLELVGFFSRKHQGIFVHHGEMLHLHFIDSETGNSGHIDDFESTSDLEISYGLQTITPSTSKLEN